MPKKNGVKETALHLRVRHAETYLTTFPKKRLGLDTHEDVAGYLKHAGELDGMVGWRFVQLADFIQNLLVTARIAVAEDVDWAFLRDSACTQGAGHPKLAREASPVHGGPSNGASSVGIGVRQETFAAPDAQQG